MPSCGTLRLNCKHMREGLACRIQSLQQIPKLFYLKICIFSDLHGLAVRQEEWRLNHDSLA